MKVVETIFSNIKAGVYKKFTSVMLSLCLFHLTISGCITIGFETYVNQEKKIEVRFETPPNPTATQPVAFQGTPPSTVQEINCMGASQGDQLKILHHWTGEEEEKFNIILKPLLDKCGIKIVTSTILIDDSIQDSAELQQKVEGTSPDIIFWPWVDALQKYKNQLYDLRSLGAIPNNYANFWRDLGTVNDHWLAVPVKIGIKSLIWYSPTQFQAFGYHVPTTFDELTTLVYKMASDGNIPWSMGLESGGASGWLGTDFIQDLLLVQQGPQYIIDIISGKVPYNDPNVAEAYQTYIKWASNPKYALGGSAGTLNTSFYGALSDVFADHPKAMMVSQADWVNNYIVGQWPNFKYEIDYDFFAFPGLKGLQGDADYMMVFHDSFAVRAMVTYLTSPTGANAWAQANLGISPNKLAVGKYKDPFLAKIAEVVSNASGFSPDLGDSIGGVFKQAEWAAVLKTLQGADIVPELSIVASQHPTQHVEPVPTSTQKNLDQFAKISDEVPEVNLRQTPGYLNKDDKTDVIIKIPSAALVKIIGGPEGKDGLSWWKVSWNSYEGWIADRTGTGRPIMVFNP